MLEFPADEKVLGLISASPWLSARLLTAHTVDQAQSLYDDALAIPQDETRAFVFNEENIRLDGDIPIKGAQTALFLRAFDHDIPKVVKITKERAKAFREAEFYEGNIARIEEENLALVPIRMLKLSGEYTSQHSPTRALNCGLLMPYYAATLNDVPPPVGSTFASSVYNRILGALTFMNEVGWVHGDVKPSNILISTDGTVWLGDFGSAVRVTMLHTFLGGTLRYQCAAVNISPDPARFDRIGLVLSLLYLHGATFPAKNLPIDSLDDLIQMITAADIEESVKRLYRSAIG